MSEVFMNKDELYHYGVKGMRWGVRRYENYPGSYTQKGVKQFKEQSDKYDVKRGEYLNAKQRYKTGQATRLDVNTAKLNMKQQKRKMKSSYKHLKQDKLGDEGKELYARGKRITWNATSAKFREVGVAIAAGMLKESGYGDLAYKVAVGGTAANIGLWAVEEHQNRRLRAYYGHQAWRG